MMMCSAPRRVLVHFCVWLTVTQAFLILGGQRHRHPRLIPSLGLVVDPADQAVRVAPSTISPSHCSTPFPAKLSSPSTSPTWFRIRTIVEPTGTAQVFLGSLSRPPDTTGSLFTTVNPSGGDASAPLMTSLIPSPSTLLKAVTNMYKTGPAPSTQTVPVPRPPTDQIVVADLFGAPIGTKPPPSTIKVVHDHPVPRLGITSKAPLQTNKFYAGFFLGDQTGPSYTYPYSINWAAGKGESGSWGLSISHTDAKKRVFGPPKYDGAASYYINPVGIQYMVLSATELGSDTALTVDRMTPFSALVSLRPNPSSAPAVVFPLVHGMPFITAQYSGAHPVLQTGAFFKVVTRVTTDPRPNVTKFNVILEDGTVWRVYARHTQGDPLDLSVQSQSLATSNSPFYGTVQVCKDPGSGAEAVYDQAAGAFPISIDLSAVTDGVRGTYSFHFQRDGDPAANLIMFALPHHVESFDAVTNAQITALRLVTPTKGVAVAMLGEVWTMVEPRLPVSMSFAPWSPLRGSVTKLSSAAKAIIASAAAEEISQDILAQTDLNSIYFSGKALVKFAQIIYVIHDLLGNTALAKTGLDQLKVAFARFSQGQNQCPLLYETAWGGVLSSATYVTGNSGDDFGNTFYNDHHFHYGYHILAAAIIGHLDPTWIPSNRDYVNTLVRDIANPSALDPYFPVSRMFDWYHGHSWAHGLFPTADGKDQESSSEDVMHAYALKMWGMVSGDSHMAARGNLQLAVTARALQLYYLYTSDNTDQPEQFIGNKVAGIMFENKIDHTTYFSPDIEAVQGIHMIPILAATPYVRKADFVQQEWQTYFDQGRIDAIENAWRGVLLANYATIDPGAAWDAFRASDYDPAWIDGGASLTWYLAFSAALGNY